MKTTCSLLSICVAGLITLGLVMLYSSSMPQYGTKLLMAQMQWVGIGLVAVLIAAGLPQKGIKFASIPSYVVAITLLAVVLLWMNPINNSQRWLKLGGFSFQPSEFAKIAVVLLLAYYADRYQRNMPSFWRGMVVPGFLIVIPFALIFEQPDRGTAILLAGVSCGVLLVAGVRWRHFLPPLIGGLACVVVIISQQEMPLNRLKGWWNLEKDASGVNWQANESMIALGRGGLDGVGLGNSQQKLGFVPYNESDFIFCIIGEELGLVATLSVVAAFSIIVVCGILIAWNASSQFGLLLGSGLTFLIGFQAFINIGVVTSFLPNKGLALPFISYGGSSLVTMMVAVGLLLNLALQESEPSEARVPSANRSRNRTPKARLARA